MYPDNQVVKARQELHAAVIADLKSGMGYMPAAVKHGVSITTIYNIAKKYGCIRGKRKAAQAVQELANGQ
jgi:transposase